MSLVREELEEELEKQELEEELEEESEEESDKPFFLLDDGRFEITEEHITESRPIRMLYGYGWVGELPDIVIGNSGPIVRKALDFCRDRGNIKKQYWKDKNVLQKKLKVFDDKFFQDNHSDAIDLADVACRLQIRSLYHLMKERAAEMLAEKTPDDIRKLLKIHYVEDAATAADDLRKMKRVVGNAGWAFRPLRSFLDPVVSDA